MKGYLGETVVNDLSETPFKGFTQKEWAAYFLAEFGGFDGEHHKQWAIDQALRILKGTEVTVKLARWESGYSEYRVTTAEPSEQYQLWVKSQAKDGDEWDAGIAP